MVRTIMDPLKKLLSPIEKIWKLNLFLELTETKLSIQDMYWRKWTQVTKKISLAKLIFCLDKKQQTIEPGFVNPGKWILLSCSKR